MNTVTRLLASVTILGTGHRCPGCGASTVTIVCARCVEAMQATPPATAAAFRDEGAVGRMVRAAKRGDWRAGGRVLAAIVVLERIERVPACDVITWVPADRRRRAVRGGHLPERFARELGAQLGVPVVEVLRRRDRRRAQRGLGRRARRRNVDGAFALRDGREVEHVRGARVLVVDDVRTTGATLAAARACVEHIAASTRGLAIVGVETHGRFGRTVREIPAQDSARTCR